MTDVQQEGRHPGTGGSLAPREQIIAPPLPDGKPDESIDWKGGDVGWRLSRYGRSVFWISDPGTPREKPQYEDRYDNPGRAAAAYASAWWDDEATVPRPGDEIQVFHPGRASDFMRVVAATGDHERGWRLELVPCLSFDGPPTPVVLHLPPGGDSFVWTSRRL